METTTHYTRIGIFVITFSVIFVILVLWLSAGLGSKNYNTYIVLMRESVSGLSKKATVKYNGVDIGTVTKISLYKKNPSLVQLKLDIDATVPIYADTKATLEMQGLTGIAYVELSGGRPGSPHLKRLHGEKYPIIPTAPSLMFRLDATLNKLSNEVEEVSSRLLAILSKDNTQSLRVMLRNFELISYNLNKNTAHLNTIMDNVSTASKDLPEAINSVRLSADQIKVTMRDLNQQLMPQIQTSIDDFQTTMAHLKNVSAELDENPAILVRGKSAEKPGPGE